MKRIVVCEDEPITLRDLRIACNTDFSKIIKEFQDGNEFLEWFRFHSNEVDVVILDIVLKKVDGFVLFHEILNIRPSIPVIFISIENSIPLIRYLASIGAKDYIVKPIKLEQLKIKMQNLLKKL
ncbi:MAG: response regulator [Leptospiraceae bacterium]|nr:response regulator [Leptospiraceae bacterium]MDW7976482.1 response regulator [Leptospiraceae bacterium]